MNTYGSIKTRIFGGFDKAQVDSYLNELHAEYENAAASPELSEAREKIKQLKSALLQKDSQLSELKSNVTELNSNDSSETKKPYFNTLTDSAKRFLDAHNEVLQIASETGDYVKSVEQRLPIMFEHLTEISRSMDSISRELGEISTQCDEIYKRETPPAEEQDSANEMFPDIPNNSFLDALQSDAD